jgi:cytochrome c554/c'-like protein
MPFRPHVLSSLAGTLICVAAISPAASAQGKTEAACVSCHRARSESQPRTPMGRALALPDANPVLKDNPKLTVRKGPYTYTVETHSVENHGDESTYSVSDGTRTISVPIHWNFGEGAQTWVLDYNGRRYESTVSFYPSISGLDFTTGDEDLKPKNLEEAIGREIELRETKVCFGCHASNAVTNGKMTYDTLRTGVTCEHCHAGTSTHLIDASNGDFGSAPPDLRKWPSEDISNFCGQCHRSWETVVRNRWRGRLTVRFQPYRLANSKCFDGADPRISCIACHDPHQDVVRQDSSYDAQCLACHSPASSSSAAVSPASSTLAAKPQTHAKICPTAKADCVSCHMPKVRLPNGLMTFTDHQIRVVRPGEPFPN